MSEKRTTQKPKPEARGNGRGEQRPPRKEKRDDRSPRHATSPAARTSGNSGGMDFDKPYEPSTAPTTVTAAQPQETNGRKRPAQAIPALFRRKAA